MYKNIFILMLLVFGTTFCSNKNEQDEQVEAPAPVALAEEDAGVKKIGTEFCFRPTKEEFVENSRINADSELINLPCKLILKDGTEECNHSEACPAPFCAFTADDLILGINNIHTIDIICSDEEDKDEYYKGLAYIMGDKLRHNYAFDKRQRKKKNITSEVLLYYRGVITKNWAWHKDYYILEGENEKIDFSDQLVRLGKDGEFEPVKLKKLIIDRRSCENAIKLTSDRMGVEIKPIFKKIDTTFACNVVAITSDDVKVRIDIFLIKKKDTTNNR